MGRLTGIQTVLLDLDGTLYVGSQVVPGAPEAVRWLRDQSVAVRFTTNTDSVTPAALADRPRPARRPDLRGGGSPRSWSRPGCSRPQTTHGCWPWPPPECASCWLGSGPGRASRSHTCWWPIPATGRPRTTWTPRSGGRTGRGRAGRRHSQPDRPPRRRRTPGHRRGGCGWWSTPPARAPGCWASRRPSSSPPPWTRSAADRTPRWSSVTTWPLTSVVGRRLTRSSTASPSCQDCSNAEYTRLASRKGAGGQLRTDTCEPLGSCRRGGTAGPKARDADGHGQRNQELHPRDR